MVCLVTHLGDGVVDTRDGGRRAGFRDRDEGFLLARSWNMPEFLLGGSVGQVADCDGLNLERVGLGWRCRPVREMLPCRGVVGTLGADVVTCCWNLVRMNGDYGGHQWVTELGEQRSPGWGQRRSSGKDRMESCF